MEGPKREISERETVKTWKIILIAVLPEFVWFMAPVGLVALVLIIRP